MTKRTQVPGLGDGDIMRVRIGPGGDVRAGNATPEFAELISYAAQMADLVGEMLGLEAFVSIEVSQAGGSCVVARAADSELLAARGGRAYDAAALRQSLTTV